MNQKQIRAAVEAMLFAYAEPIGADRLAQALQLPIASVEPALETLHERYQKEDSGLCLLHLNTHWQLATKTDFVECVRRVLDTRRSIPLGPAAMETLTVIAYNQPVSRAFIEQVRGFLVQCVEPAGKGAHRGGWPSRPARQAGGLPHHGCIPAVLRPVQPR